MRSFPGEIADHFPAASKPSVADLVVKDGFDELEKAYAVDFYARKSWEDVLAHLRRIKRQSNDFGVEEWSVLAKDALSYYLRAHLEFLLEQLNSDDPDEMFIWFFFHQLYQVAYMYKGSPFSPAQTAYLKDVVQVMADDAEDRARYGDYGAEIQRNVVMFLEALGDRSQAPESRT